MAARESTMPFYILVPWCVKSPRKLEGNAPLPEQVQEGCHLKDIPTFYSWKDVEDLGVLLIITIIIFLFLSSDAGSCVNYTPQFVAHLHCYIFQSSLCFHVFILHSCCLTDCAPCHPAPPPISNCSNARIFSYLHVFLQTLSTCIINLHNSMAL